MKKFLDEQFLLQNSTAQKLYNDFAKDLPIIDYHNHLPPEDIVNDRVFKNITEAWLEGDHYKWRAMRANGVDEKYCTGDASPHDKFLKWAETVPYTMKNPLYHWTHLELQRYFQITKLLNPETAEDIFIETNQLLSSSGTVDLLLKMNVEVVCTTDDPTDDLSFHRKWKEMQIDMVLLPTFRADKVLQVENVGEWNRYIEKLEQITNISIKDFQGLMDALESRHDFFHSVGCRLSDNGLQTLYSDPFTESEINVSLVRLRNNDEIDNISVNQFRSAVLLELSKLNHKKGWTQQFHIGALRNTNKRMMLSLGPDTGFDSIGDENQAVTMARFFDTLDASNQLAKTIIYNLNPADNAVFASMIGNYNDGTIAGKMQFGSGWWYLDQKDGIEQQINVLSNMGLLSRFVGMLTDSRSFLSFPRHEYFRRVLCNVLGTDIENGELPNDISWIGKLIKDICYYNAREYFQFQKSS